MANTDVVLERQIDSLVEVIAARVVERLRKETDVNILENEEGYWLKLNLNQYSDGSHGEPFMINGYRNGSRRRATWVNENGSLRCASVNDEPALKVFGPAANTNYSGQVMQVLSRHSGGNQVHLFGVSAAGKPIVGSGATVGSFAIVLGASETIPAGLPSGTIIVRKPT